MNETLSKRRGPLLWMAARTWRFWCVLLILLPALYLVGFGPACWLSASSRPYVKGEAPRLLMRLYFPIGAVIHKTRTESHSVVVRWIMFGFRRGERVLVPTDSGGDNWYGFTAE